MASVHANDLGRAEGRETVHQCDTDLDFGGLAVWISCADAFSEGLQAPHLCFDPASDMVSGPAFPECSAVVSGGAQGFVAGARRRTVLFPWSAVLADRDDRSGMTVDDGGMAAAGAIGA